MSPCEPTLLFVRAYRVSKSIPLYISSWSVHRSNTRSVVYEFLTRDVTYVAPNSLFPSRRTAGSLSIALLPPVPLRRGPVGLFQPMFAPAFPMMLTLVKANNRPVGNPLVGCPRPCVLSPAQYPAATHISIRSARPRPTPLRQTSTWSDR